MVNKPNTTFKELLESKGKKFNTLTLILLLLAGIEALFFIFLAIKYLSIIILVNAAILIGIITKIIIDKKLYALILFLLVTCPLGIFF